MIIEDLALKAVFFESIKRGAKTVEYRDFSNPYYIRKFVDTSKYPSKKDEEIADILVKGGKLYPRGVTHLRFHCQGKTMLVEVKDITVYNGHTTFAIKLGKIVKE